MVSDRLYCLKSSELDLKEYYCKPPTHFHLMHFELQCGCTQPVLMKIRVFFHEYNINVIEFSCRLVYKLHTDVFLFVSISYE